MKDDEEEGGHPYMEVLGVLEKKLRNFDKDAIFEYHEEQIRNNNE
jgi:hypothetical protein